MFQVNTNLRVTPQKNRTNKFKFNYRPNNNLVGWYKIITIGQGFITHALMSRMFTWAKRVIYFPNSAARFWVNVQINKIITRKAANTRMGKGKGSRVTTVGFVSSNVVLLATSKIRAGKRKRLLRQIQVRCPFLVGAEHTKTNLSRFFNKFKIRQRNFIFNKKWEYFTLFKQTQQRELFAFFSSIFKWYYRRPLVLSTIRITYNEEPLMFNDFPIFGEIPTSTPLYRALWSFSLRVSVFNLPIFFYFEELNLNPLDVLEEVFPFKKTPLRFADDVKRNTELIVMHALYPAKFNSTNPYSQGRLNAIRSYVYTPNKHYLQWLALLQVNQLFWATLIHFHNSETFFK